MLSSIRYSLFAIMVTIFIAGCANKSYYPTTYSPSYSHNYSYGSTPKNSYSIHRATLRPYEVNGKTYYPTVVKVGSRYRGIASWYGPDFHGRKTSSGEYYNMYDFTAAHKTLPMNTIVKVTNLNNGKSTIVRINDRGPFVKNRIIDLSYAAAKQIGMVNTGTAPVEIEVLGFDKTISTLAKTAKREVKIGNFGVQIGAFRRYQGALITQDRYKLVDGRYKAIIKKFIIDGEPLYRVWLMGFKSEEEARDFIASNRFRGAFIVRE